MAHAQAMLALRSHEVRDKFRALQYVREALKECAERNVGTTFAQVLMLNTFGDLLGAVYSGMSNDKLAQRIRKLLETIAELEVKCHASAVEDLEQVYKDQLEGAEAQMAEFGEELEKLQAKYESGSSLGAPVIPSVMPPAKGASEAISVARIEAELERREAYRKKMRETQEDYENHLLDLQETLERVEGEERRGQCISSSKEKPESLNKRIKEFESAVAGIVESNLENDREVRELERYRDAIKLVAEGLAPGLIGKKL